MQLFMPNYYTRKHGNWKDFFFLRSQLCYNGQHLFIVSTCNGWEVSDILKLLLIS